MLPPAWLLILGLNPGGSDFPSGFPDAITLSKAYVGPSRIRSLRTRLMPETWPNWKLGDDRAGRLSKPQGCWAHACERNK